MGRMKKVEFDVSKFKNDDVLNVVVDEYNRRHKDDSLLGVKISHRDAYGWDAKLPENFVLADNPKILKLVEKDFLSRQKDMIKKCTDIIKKADVVLHDHKKYKVIMDNSENAIYCQVFQDIDDLYKQVIKSNAHYNFKYRARHRELNTVNCA